MKLYLIRHGATAGNSEKRYIGRTDEPLCEEGIEQIGSLHIPVCGVTVSSPMKRCLQTAEILFPNSRVVVCEGLRECDFGDFEGKNYAELNGDPRYQAWIDSGGELPFPNGESPDGFRKRCCEAFSETVGKYAGAENIAFVVHDGTIMSVLDRYAVPHRSYFDWHCGNGDGYLCEFDGEKIYGTVKL